jgi:hypothetical protein
VVTVRFRTGIRRPATTWSGCIATDTVFAVRLVAVLLIALVATATAVAGTLRGSDRPELIAGTRSRDVVSALGGDDRVLVWGDGRRDEVRCGSGLDLVNAERNDTLAADCETVLHQLSRDRTDSAGAQRGTQAEPDSFSWGDTVVAVFQSGRYTSGGAAAVAFATSRDRGRTWIEGTLPAAAGYMRQTDPVVTYDAARSTWLAAALGIAPDVGSALLVFRSPDGVAWQPPVVVAADDDHERGPDKEWIACDNGDASALRGRCYLAYTDLLFSAIALRSSADGGLTWSNPVYGPPSAQGASGAYPVVRGDGGLVVLYTDADHGVDVLLSIDGGASLRRVDRLPQLNGHELEGLRAPELVAADADARGRIVAVWQDCSFQPGCAGNDVVMSESQGGVSWSPPRPLPTRSVGSAFIPTVAIDRATGRIAVLYYAATGCPARCRIDAWLIESADGQRWTPPLRLSARSMEPSWLARTTQGAMLADYISVSYVDGRPLAVLALAQEPVPGRLREAIFATSRVGALRVRRGSRR